MKRELALALILFSVLCPVARAGGEGGDLPTDLTELKIEELMQIDIGSVSGASRFEQKVTEAPASVSIITADAIKKYGYRTLADILRSVRGFFITYDRNYSYIGARGFARPGDYNTRVLLLVDGHRVNDNIYGTAMVGTEFPVDVDLIDRVEVIRGPSSSLYGAGAFFGVIDVTTRRGRQLKGVEASGEGGSFETYKGRLTYGNRFDNGLEMIFSGSLFRSQGRNLYFEEFDTHQTNYGIAEKKDDDRFDSFFAKVSYRDFTVEGAYVSREKGIPTASWGTVFNDSRNRTTDATAFLELKYDHTFAGQLNVLARLYYDRYEYRGGYVYDYPPRVLNRDSALGESMGGEIKISRPLWDRHRLTLGGEYRDSLRQDQENHDQFPYTLYLDDKRKGTDWAIYGQDEFRILKNLILNAGVRYDHYSTFGGTTNPRVALIWLPLEKTSLKLLYGTAFRAPNAYELYYTAPGSQSSPDLKPETISTYELAWDQYFGRNFHGTAAVFYYRIRNLISQQENPKSHAVIFANAGEIEAKGLELEFEGRWASGFEGRANYTLTSARNRETGETLTNSPKHLAKLNLTVPLVREKLFLGLEEQYTSRRKTLAGRETEAAFITNVTLFSRELIKGLDISGTVYNLFNSRIADPGGEEHTMDTIREDGRTYRLKVTYRF